jgi:hypothetical protein
MNNLEFTIENYEKGIMQYYPSTLSLRTERTCTPSILSGEIPDIGDRIPEMGATVRLKVDGVLMFLGRIFSTSINRWGVLSFTAYDGLRYLKNTFSNSYERNYSPRTVITDIINQYGLKLGKIADVPNIGQKLTIDNESCFDVISKIVDISIVQTKRILVFYDNFGEFTLSYADEMISDAVIGDKSLATEYTLNTDIDSDTYNEVYLYRESSAAAARAYVPAVNNDNENVQRWGQLCLIESVDDIVSVPQMQDRANKMLEMKNRPLKTMNISAYGVVGLRAGMVITINFPSLKDSVSKRQMVILDAVEHKFEDSVHTMELETRTFWRDS